MLFSNDKLKKWPSIKLTGWKNDLLNKWPFQIRPNDKMPCYLNIFWQYDLLIKWPFYEMTGWPGACTIKYYGFVVYRIRNKLVCLSLLVCFMSGHLKATSLLQNLWICHKLRICNGWPGACTIKHYGFVIYGKFTDFVVS